MYMEIFLIITLYLYHVEQCSHYDIRVLFFLDYFTKNGKVIRIFQRHLKKWVIGILEYELTTNHKTLLLLTFCYLLIIKKLNNISLTAEMAPSSTARSGSPTNALSNGDSNKSENLLWRLDAIPGKGKALIATEDIAPGTLILSDPALITTECITSEETTEKDLGRALRALPKDLQRAYLSLHNNYPGEGNPLTNIVRSNGYPLGPSGAGGVFVNVSRINHSCKPNAKHTWNSKLQQQTVYAIRKIHEGEEITLSYLAGGSSEERQGILKSHFRFECKCELCSLPPNALRASDGRIIRAQNLSEGIEDVDTQVKNPTKLIKNGFKLLKVYEEEGIKDDRLGNLYWEMFKISNKHRDQARASVFAQKYSDSKLMAEGPQSANVLEMIPIIKNPSSDSTFGQALKKKSAMKRRGEDLGGFEDTEGWKSAAADRPKDLEGEKFEKWLWRQDI